MASLGKMYGKRIMGVQRQACRAFYTRSKDKVLKEEEIALETVYIQKMEREKLEKSKKKVAKEKSGDIQIEGSAEKISAVKAELRHAAG